MVFRKGGDGHRVSGQVFVGSMLVLALTGAVVGFQPRPGVERQQGDPDDLRRLVHLDRLVHHDDPTCTPVVGSGVYSL